MKTLELKHLAPYLPYELRFRSFLSKDESTYTLTSGNLNNWEQKSIRIIPILRPLSDITKEIEVNGEKFVTIEMLGKLFQMNVIEYCNLEQNKSLSETIKNQRWCVIEKLFEWHFDIFGLIEQNLAIDINTL